MLALGEVELISSKFKRIGGCIIQIKESKYIAIAFCDNTIKLITVA
jgi:hypothetical protein